MAPPDVLVALFPINVLFVPVFEEREAVHMGEAEAVDETDCGGVGGVVATGSGDGWRNLGKPKARSLERCHVVDSLLVTGLLGFWPDHAEWIWWLGTGWRWHPGLGFGLGREGDPSAFDAGGNDTGRLLDEPAVLVGDACSFLVGDGAGFLVIEKA